jgi:P-type E1-E2 ATPase
VYAYVKGSPERISALCEKNTLPNDFDEVLEQYTSQGLRVIALSYREIPNAKDE